MNEHELRFVELSFRMATLIEMKTKLNQDLESKAIMLLAKTFDSEAESKQIGMISLLDKWIKEIEAEADALEGKVFQRFMQQGFDQMETKLAEHKDNN